MKPRWPFITVCLALCLSPMEAQLSSNPGWGISGSQDQSNAVDGITYQADFTQQWIDPNFATGNLPTSVDFNSSQTGTITFPIYPSSSYAPGADDQFLSADGTYGGYSAGYGIGFSTEFAVNFTSNPPATFALSSLYHGGTLDGTSTTLNYDATSLPSLPLFSAGTYDTFTGGTESGTTTVTFSPFTGPADAVGGSRSFGLIRLSGGEAVLLNVSLGTDVDSYDLDTSLIQPGNTYYLFLDDSYTTLDSIGYNVGTTLTFTSAVPEPSSYALLAGAGALGFCLRRRSRRIRVAYRK